MLQGTGEDMATLHIEHPISDLGTWLTAFQKFATVPAGDGRRLRRAKPQQCAGQHDNVSTDRLSTPPKNICSDVCGSMHRGRSHTSGVERRPISSLVVQESIFRYESKNGKLP